MTLIDWVRILGPILAILVPSLIAWELHRTPGTWPTIIQHRRGRRRKTRS